MYTRLADLQDFVDVPEEGAYLGADVPQRSNCDKASTTGTWGEELLELCRSTELLIVNGRTPGDPTGRFTFTSPQGQSVVDYFLVSAQHLSSVADMRVMCDAQYCNLSRDMPYDREKSDHFPLQLDLSLGAQFAAVRWTTSIKAIQVITRTRQRDSPLVRKLQIAASRAANHKGIP